MLLTIGVDMTDINSRTNDAKSRIVKGVAGLNIAREVYYRKTMWSGAVATATMR